MSGQDNFSQCKTHHGVYKFNVTSEKDIHVETDRVGDGILTNHSIRTERR